jgi:hypothetical protein
MNMLTRIWRTNVPAMPLQRQEAEDIECGCELSNSVNGTSNK